MKIIPDKLKTWLGFPPQQVFEMEKEFSDKLSDDEDLENSNQNTTPLTDTTTVVPVPTDQRQKREITEAELILLPTQLITSITTPVVFYFSKEINSWVASVTGGVTGFIGTGVDYFVLQCVSPLKAETSVWLKGAFIGAVNGAWGFTNSLVMKTFNEGLKEEGEFELEEVKETKPAEFIETALKGMALAGGTALLLYGSAKLIQQFGLRKNNLGFSELKNSKEPLEISSQENFNQFTPHS